LLFIEKLLFHVIGFFFQLNCQHADLCGAGYEINNLQNKSDLSDLWMRTINENQNKYNQIDLTLKPKDEEQTEQAVTILIILFRIYAHIITVT